jgi:hypothetical protein
MDISRLLRAQLLLGLPALIAGAVLGFAAIANAKYERLSANGCTTNPGSPIGGSFGSYGYLASNSSAAVAHCPFIERDTFTKSAVVHAYIDIRADPVTPLTNNFAWASIEAFDGSTGSTSGFVYPVVSGWNSLQPNISTIWSSTHASDYAAVHVAVGSGTNFQGILFAD